MKRYWALLGLWLAITSQVAAAGLIIVHEPDFWRPRPPGDPWWPGPRPPLPPPRPLPPPQPVWAPLEVSFTKATAKIQNQIATTQLEQEFYNPNARQLEGTFLFPAPKGAHINRFAMEINGKQVEAELLVADKARGIYEDIVRRLKDPALLEYADRDLFKVRIFPIEPHSRKRITLSFSQVLKSDAGLVSYTLPLNTEKFSAKPLRNLSVKLDLETKRPLKAIYSPSHKVEVRRDGDRRATVGFEASEVKPETDFQLLYAEEAGDLGLNLVCHKTAGEEGYFLLLASPGEVKSGKVIPKDVAFVLDTSGSMAGSKLEQAKRALLFCVANLNDSDRFEIVRFSTEVEPLFDKLTEAGPEARTKAERFIKDLKPIGGTALDEALRKALALRPEQGDRPYVVIFLTDGRPTVGNTDENQIVQHVTGAPKSLTRVFCFGIGSDVNTHLLDKITEGTRAYSQYVLPDEDLELKVSSFYTKIKEPVLANLKLTLPEGVRATKIYPAPLPDLFKGEQLVVAGRYSGQGQGTVIVEGSVAGETRKFSYEAQFSGDAAENEFIPRLWATRRVGYLLDESRLHGENKELRDEVTELARRYGIITPYTSYLILEDERRLGVAMDNSLLPETRRNETVRLQAAESFAHFSNDKEGDQAVAGASSFRMLKSADQAEPGIARGNYYAFRAAPAASLPAQPSDQNSAVNGLVVGGGVANLSGPSGGRVDRRTGGATGPVQSLFGGGGGPTARAKVANAEQAAQQYAQQSRYVGGRTFYQTGSQWIDGEVQKQTQAKRVRLQFESKEYFDFVKAHPKTLAWLALGKNVQFLLGETVYEVYE